MVFDWWCLKERKSSVCSALVRRFLTYLKEVRQCGTNTHNQRLAAIHALAVFVANRSPEHLAWCSEVRAVHSRGQPEPSFTTSTKPRWMQSWQWQSKDSLLPRGVATTLCCYSLTTLARAPMKRHGSRSLISISRQQIGMDKPTYRSEGKGGRTRQCPLWPPTVREIKNSIAKRQPHEHVFLTRLLRPYTRVGIYELVNRYGQRAALAVPSIATKQISPHIIRHSTAMHLLRAGVDINTRRGWLGHVSLRTTNIYAEIDLEMKAKALQFTLRDARDARTTNHIPSN